MIFTIYYLDPGTGSLLLYALIGITATLFFSLRGIWYRLISSFSLGNSQKGQAKTLPDLVFHSEGGKYWPVFESVILALIEMKVPSAYITPDENDPALSLKDPHFHPYRPGKEMATLAYMNQIKTKLVISTSPHLNVYMMKRSPHVEKYIHLFHTPTSVDFYEIFAFNYYDIFLTTGDYLEKDLRQLREKRNLSSAEYYPVGCTYYDKILNSKEEIESSNKQDVPTILYAPTWGDRSSIIHYENAVLSQLVEEDYSIIFRPHPQFYVSHKKQIDEIEAFIKDHDNITLDRHPTPGPAMEKADLMITDFSGVLFDFAILQSKPIILLEQALNMRGFEGQDLKDSWDIQTARELSLSIKPGQIDLLKTSVHKLLSVSQDIQQRSKHLKEKELVNFGTAGEATAKTLTKLLSQDIEK